MKENEIGGTRSRQLKMPENAYSIWRNEVNGRMILKWISNKQDVRTSWILAISQSISGFHCALLLSIAFISRLNA